MKNKILLVGCLLLAGFAMAEHTHDGVACTGHDHAADEADHASHEGHDHGAECTGHDEHEGHDHASHEGHDHDADEAEHDEHEGHDHGAECTGHNEHEGHDHASHEGHDHGDAGAGLALTDEMMAKVGIELHTALGGTVSRHSVFPAEVKLNNDRSAAVSPRYPSVVRQVFAEIGDEVRKGDVLATLENRETMAVYSVSAPLDGLIIAKDLSVGETAAEDRILFQVADLSSVWVDINVFPSYQHLVRKGMQVEFIAHDGHTANGTVKFVSPLVSVETRTFTARCVLEDAQEDFTPGVFVRARMVVEEASAAVVVPDNAVQEIDGESVLFVPNEHGFQTVSVKTGLSDGTSVEILSGLKPGAEFVGQGAFSLKAQMVTSGLDPHAGHGH